MSHRREPFKAKIVKYINNINKNEPEELSNLSPSEALTKFEEFILNLENDVAKREVKTCHDWSMQSEGI